MLQATTSVIEHQSVERQIAAFVAKSVVQWLYNARVVPDDLGTRETVLWVVPSQDRIIISVNPVVVRNAAPFLRASSRTEQVLSSVLQGRRVAVSSGRGFWIQVAYFTEDREELESKPLDLSRQPGPYHVPIGTFNRGALWRPLPKMVHVLIGGTSGSGKTNLLHTWIQALIRGEEARLVLYDGKGGTEFGIYAGAPRVRFVPDDGIVAALESLAIEMTQRFEALKEAGVRNVDVYNAGRGVGARMERIVLVIDELGDVLGRDGVLDRLVALLRRGRAVGIHCVLATQRPSADVVPGEIKVNCPTRIAFAVPDMASSRVILDRSGAERLPADAPGRMIFSLGAAAFIAQAFVAPEYHATAPLAFPIDDTLNDEEREYLGVAIWNCAGQWRAEEIANIIRRADAGGKRAVGANGSPRAYVPNKNRVSQVAQRLERLGYLTAILTEPGTGRRMGRKVTAKTLELLGVEPGLGGTEEQADLAGIAAA